VRKRPDGTGPHSKAGISDPGYNYCRSAYFRRGVCADARSQIPELFLGIKLINELAYPAAV
jgi:hypothetical protein